MELTPISLAGKLELFDDHWAPRIIAQMNDLHVKLAKVQGVFTRHSHPETDELFLVLAGELRIEYWPPDGGQAAVELSAGELVVMPRGVEHRPVAERECHLLLVEPAGTVNTGQVVNEHTAAADIWI